MAEERRSHAVCPWWIGYVLASPLRRLFESPEQLLQPFVLPGMTVLEPGCGMGYFSIPLARLVGPNGRVICVDMQQKMIDGLQRRARRAGVLDSLETIVCSPSDLGLRSWRGKADVALAIHMLHEVPDQALFLRQVHEALRPGGTFVIVEPTGHVTPEQFATALARAEAQGLMRSSRTVPGKKLSAVLSK